MAWEIETEAFCAWLQAGGASPALVRLRRHYLRRLSLSTAGGPWQVTLEDLVGFVARPGWRPETRKAARGSVRAFYRWAVTTGRTPVDPSVLLPPVRIPPAVPRPAPDHVLARALLAAGPGRDRVMLLLGALAGLRRAEIATLRVADVAGDQIYVRGKGGRTRVVPVHPLLAPEIAAWLAGRMDGWVFPGKVDGHLSAHHVGKRMAALLGPGWSAHKLRHRFATRAYGAERDLLAVQQLLGHSRPETTARYVQLPDDALRVAVAAA
jgi:integrase/recombinase XerC